MNIPTPGDILHHLGLYIEMDTDIILLGIPRVQQDNPLREGR